MNMARGAAAGLLALLGVALPGVAAAQDMRPATAPWRAFDRAPSDIAIVTLASDEPGGTAPRKLRHALRIRSTLAESAVRSIGIDASDCAMLLKVHSRAVSGAGGTSLVLHPQMHLACRF